MRCLLDAITDVEMKILCVCDICNAKIIVFGAARFHRTRSARQSGASQLLHIHIYVARIILKTHTDGDAHTQHPCGAATEMICIYTTYM